MTLRIDFQTHTDHSPVCGWMEPATLVRRAEKVGLDGIAVTDHNTMDGVSPARQAASDDFLVVPGEEIDTTEGQIIGLFLSEPIDPWQSPGTVIDRIHGQGGLALTPHPFDAVREGLATIAEHADALDAVETLNARCLLDRFNDRARSFAAEHEIPAIGGSDAHFPREVGTAHTLVGAQDGDGSERSRRDAVEAALRAGATEPAGSKGSPLVHAGTKALKLYRRSRRR